MANIQCPHLGAPGDLRSDLRGYPWPKIAKTVFFTLARARPEPDPSPKMQSPSPPEKTFKIGPRPDPSPSPKTKSPSPPEPEES